MIVWKIKALLQLAIKSGENLKIMIIFILDNTAFASGFNLNILASLSDEVQFYTTPEIINEATKNRQSAQVVEIAQYQQNLHIQSPDSQFLMQIQNQAQHSGDIGALSQADQSILALTLELSSNMQETEIILCSDDFSVLNTAAFLKIATKTFQTEGIQEKIIWETYCPECRRKYPPKKLHTPCPNCGTKLKRRRKKK